MILLNRNRFIFLKIFFFLVRKYFLSFFSKRVIGLYKKLNNEFDKNFCIKFRLN